MWPEGKEELAKKPSRFQRPLFSNGRARLVAILINPAQLNAKLEASQPSSATACSFFCFKTVLIPNAPIKTGWAKAGEPKGVTALATRFVVRVLFR